MLMPTGHEHVNAKICHYRACGKMQKGRLKGYIVNFRRCNQQGDAAKLYWPVIPAPTINKRGLTSTGIWPGRGSLLRIMIWIQVHFYAKEVLLLKKVGVNRLFIWCKNHAKRPKKKCTNIRWRKCFTHKIFIHRVIEGARAKKRLQRLLQSIVDSGSKLFGVESRSTGGIVSLDFNLN